MNIEGLVILRLPSHAFHSKIVSSSFAGVLYCFNRILPTQATPANTKDAISFVSFTWIFPPSSANNYIFSLKVKVSGTTMDSSPWIPKSSNKSHFSRWIFQKATPTTVEISNPIGTNKEYRSLGPLFINQRLVDSGWSCVQI
jgi:hypothetical protein